MLNCLFVGIGGFAGAICRYLMGMIPLQDKSGFPWITLCINAIGAFVIGLVTAAAAKNGWGDSHLVLFLKTGVCGGFTNVFYLCFGELFSDETGENRNCSSLYGA